jgi:hypothetical protein
MPRRIPSMAFASEARPCEGQRTFAVPHEVRLWSAQLGALESLHCSGVSGDQHRAAEDQLERSTRWLTLALSGEAAVASPKPAGNTIGHHHGEPDSGLVRFNALLGDSAHQ